MTENPTGRVSSMDVSDELPQPEALETAQEGTRYFLKEYK